VLQSHYSNTPRLHHSSLLYFHVSTPFFHAQTSPSTNNSKKTSMATNAPAGSPAKATAKGSRKIVSTSKIKKTMA